MDWFLPAIEWIRATRGDDEAARYELDLSAATHTAAAAATTLWCIGYAAARELPSEWRPANPHDRKQLFESLLHYERTVGYLKKVAATINDPAAAKRIEKALKGTRDDIESLAKALNPDDIEKFLTAQARTEDSIRALAKARTENALKLPHMREPTTELRERRQLRKETKQAVAIINYRLALVGRGGHRYCTPYELSLRRQQKAKWAKFGTQYAAVSPDGRAALMYDLITEAPRKRFSELFTLTVGLEKHAAAHGMDWTFVTLTAPPRMHINPENGNNSWDGTLPREAHKWIHEQWRKAVKRWEKAGIKAAGLRVTEPHKDGTPHWHILLFAYPDDIPAIEAELRKQPEWATEPGMKFVRNDGRAKASTYLFKYLQKQISTEIIDDTEFFTIDTETQDPSDAEKVDAWRSTHAIRSYQFLGMPALTLWRSLRRLATAPADPTLASAWRAARRGDAQAFIGIAGGIAVPRCERPIHAYEERGTHEVLTHLVNEHGEVETFARHKWTIKRAPEGKVETHPPAPAPQPVAVIPNYPSRGKETPSFPTEWALKAPPDPPPDPPPRAKQPTLQ